MNEANAQEQPVRPAPRVWKLLIIIVVPVSIVGDLYIGGPGLGMAVGALSAAMIIVLAARDRPLEPIEAPVSSDSRRRALVVLEAPLESPAEIRSVVETPRPGAADGLAPEVLLLAPCTTQRLQRWTSDTGTAQEKAQRTLDLSTASLTAAGIAVSSQTGDEDLVQAVEDTLRTFPATEVFIVAAGGRKRSGRDRQVEELRARLRVPLSVSETPGSAPDEARRQGRIPQQARLADWVRA